MTILCSRRTLWISFFVSTFLLLPVWLWNTRETSSCTMGFAGTNRVHVQKKGTIALQELRVGDYVQVRGRSSSHQQHGNKAYARVYAVAHWENEPTKFVQFRVVDNQQSASLFEVTLQQLLFVYQGHWKRSTPAGNITDDSLLISETGHAVHVQRKRRTVNRRGRYAAFTTTGDVIMNGLHVSNYAAPPAAWMTRYLPYPELVHLYLSLFRLLDLLKTSFGISSLSNDAHQNRIVQFACLGTADSWLLVTLFPWVCVAFGVEVALQSRRTMWSTVLLIGLYYLWRKRQEHLRVKKKKQQHVKQEKWHWWS